MTRATFWKSIPAQAWRPVLLGVAVVQGATILSVERDRLAEARQVRQLLAARHHGPVHDPAHDPKLGERLPVLRVTDVSGRPLYVPPPIPEQQSVLLFVGACAPCVADMLKRWQPAITPQRQLYVVTESKPEEVRRFQRMFGLTMPFVFIPPGDVDLRRYQVAWRPRTYLLDHQGRLLYLQARLEESEQARVEILKRGARLTKRGTAPAERAGEPKR